MVEQTFMIDVYGWDLVLGTIHKFMQGKKGATAMELQQTTVTNTIKPSLHNNLFFPQNLLTHKKNHPKFLVLLIVNAS